MWNCVLVGMAQTKQARSGRAQGIAGSMVKPDPVFERRGEMRRV
jgi:hypothetical protein